ACDRVRLGRCRGDGRRGAAQVGPVRRADAVAAVAHGAAAHPPEPGGRAGVQCARHPRGRGRAVPGLWRAPGAVDGRAGHGAQLRVGGRVIAVAAHVPAEPQAAWDRAM
ncbi:hypothetical protein HK405_002719, partial [Cladochytrium tenue]